MTADRSQRRSTSDRGRRGNRADADIRFDVRCRSNINTGTFVLTLAPGGTLSMTTTAHPGSIAVVDDSIKGWSPVRRGRSEPRRRDVVGMDDPILLGVGGSGYLTALTTHIAGHLEYTLYQRHDDVLRAVNGGLPSEPRYGQLAADAIARIIAGL